MLPPLCALSRGDLVPRTSRRAVAGPASSSGRPSRCTPCSDPRIGCVAPPSCCCPRRRVLSPTRGLLRRRRPDAQLEELAEELAGVDGIQAAYVKPAVELPVLGGGGPARDRGPAVTPDFSSRQGYLDPAPGGVDARYAWTWPGGGGAGVRIIDCERNWHFDHEDLTGNQGGIVVGTSTDQPGPRHRGARRDQRRPQHHRRHRDLSGRGGQRLILDAGSSAAAIRGAADRLGAGDIILLEGHRPGPRHNFADAERPAGYIAIEWWPDDFDAIRYAISRGIIVVEAAGNGAENLDDALYSTRPPGSPPLDQPVQPRQPRLRGNRGRCRCAPARNPRPRRGADRSRLGFSNSARSSTRRAGAAG